MPNNGNDDITIDGNGPCSEPEPPDDCDDDCCPDEHASGEPVKYFNGKIILTESDLSARVPGLTHRRMYRNRNYALENWDSAQGWNWAVSEWPYLVRRVVGDKETIILKHGQRPVFFDKNASNEYVARYGVASRHALTHDSSAGLLIYSRQTSRGIEVIEFQDFDQPTSRYGLMKRRIDSRGHEFVVTDYGDGTILGIETTRGDKVFGLDYEFFTSGDHIGKIENVTLYKRDASGGPLTAIRRVRYLYYDGTTNEGSLNDLKAAITQSPLNGDWKDVAVQYYRYYKEGDQNGFDHGLKYVVGPATYEELVEEGQDPLTMLTDGEGHDHVPSYADYFFEYDASHRVTREVARGCAGCGNGGAGTGNAGKQFVRTKNPDYPADPSVADDDFDFNAWMWKIVESSGQDYEIIVYTNRIGQVMLKAKREVSDQSRQWVTYNRYDNEGRLMWRAMPSAVMGYDEDYSDLVGEQPNGSFVYLRQFEGLIHEKSYYESTTATSASPGGVQGRLETTSIRKGIQGEAITTRTTKYAASDNSSGELAYIVGEQIEYPDETDQESTKVTISFEHQWYVDPPRIKEKTTHLPPIPTEQHGDNSIDTRREYYDEDGKLIWQMDERGVVTRLEYEEERGLLIQQTRDTDSQEMPSGWSPLPGPHENLVTNFAYDELGRRVLTLGPQHEAVVDDQAITLRRASYVVYKESAVEDQQLGQPPLGDQEWSGQGYAVPNESSPDGYDFSQIDPVTISFSDKAGRTLNRVVSARSSGSGQLMPTDTFLRDDWARWSSMHYNDKGQLDYQRDYHVIPPSATGLDGIYMDPGMPGENYNESFYGYAPNSNLQVRAKSPDGTVTRTVHDAINRQQATYVGTNDVPDGEGATWQDWYPGAPGTDLVVTSESEYDHGEAGGLSNVTRETAHVDAQTKRHTSYLYDSRGRRVIEDGEETHYVEMVYDNLDRVIERKQRNATSSGNLIGRSEALYDNRGREFETRTYSVDPTTGDIGQALKGENYYDSAGNLVQAVQPGSGVVRTWTTYDNLGRAIVHKRGYYVTWMAPAEPVVVDIEETEYDMASNVVQSKSSNIDADVDPTDPTYRRRYTQRWYDPIGRLISSAELGALDSPPTRSATPPDRSDTVLVTSFGYNDRGEQASQIDPKGIEVRHVFDDLARQIKQIENYVGDGTPAVPEPDSNRTTEMSYTPGGQLGTLTAVMADPAENQTTVYTYGTTLAESAIASNSLLRSTAYPDSEGDSDVVTLAYNRQQEVVKRVDQAGTEHVLEYDGLGRIIHDRVTSFGKHIQQTVKRISTQYEVRGMPKLVTSHATSDTAKNSVINQVRLEYDGFGQLVTDYQAHAGPVDTSLNGTPRVVYDFSDGSGNRSRPTQITYPNGREISLGYGPSLRLNDVLNRIEEVNDHDATTLVAYTYLGMNTTVRTSFPEAEVRLDLWGGTAGEYTGFDRFGRVTDQHWQWYGDTPPATRARLAYGYDRNSNRLWREDLRAADAPGSPEFDELYAYDGLNRLLDMQRGRLNAAKDDIASGTLQFRQEWRLDPVGNWVDFDEDVDGAGWDLEQQRQHNLANEITDVSATTGPVWPTPKYDDAGNTTVFPKPSVPEEYFKATYDAWNRLVRIEDGNKVAEYEYDGRGFCTRRRAYDGKGNLSAIFDNYYTNDWRLIETRVTHAGTTTAHLHEQYVWSHAVGAYIDSLILRDRDSNGDGDVDERLFALQDANYNVVGIVDPTQIGSPVVERFAYSPYGQRMILGENFVGPMESVHEWITGHQGLLCDFDTHIIRNRTRVLQSSLGRWLTRDLVGYLDGLSLYLYLNCSPANATDPYGMFSLDADITTETIDGCKGACLFRFRATFEQPCNPVVIQHVIASARCHECPCPTDKDLKFGYVEYWEIIHINPVTGNSPEKSIDNAWFVPPTGIKTEGWFIQSGEARLYCRHDLPARWNAGFRPNREYPIEGGDRCEGLPISAGAFPSSNERPDWWDSVSPRGAVDRQIELFWRCDCDDTTKLHCSAWRMAF